MSVEGAAAPSTPPQTTEKVMLFQPDARKMQLQAPELAGFSWRMGPKVSKGRSESPLVAPAGAKPLYLPEYNV